MLAQKNKYYGSQATLLYNVLGSWSYFKVNRRIIEKFGFHEAILLKELQGLEDCWAGKNSLTEEGFFYVFYEFLIQDIGLTKAQIIPALKNLEDNNLIETKIYNKGKKKIKYYKVNGWEVDKYYFIDGRSHSEQSENEKNFIFFNKYLAQTLNPMAAIIIGDLMSSLQYTITIGNLIEERFFYYKQNSLAKKLGVCRQYISKQLKLLEDKGFIEQKQGGYPKQTIISINIKKLTEFLQMEPYQCIELETMAYIKNNDLTKTNKLTDDQKVDIYRRAITRDGVRSSCNSYTRDDIEEFRRRAMELEAQGEQGVF